MTKIYRNASRVLIWLGQGNERYKFVLEQICAIAEGCCSRLYNSHRCSASWLANLRNEKDKDNALEKAATIQAIDTTRMDWELFWQFY
jgi:hypothetical protein